VGGTTRAPDRLSVRRELGSIRRDGKEGGKHVPLIKKIGRGEGFRGGGRGYEKKENRLHEPVVAIFHGALGLVVRGGKKVAGIEL